MAWRVVVSEDTGSLSWAQWVDQPAADGWLRELRRLVALPRPSIAEGPARVQELARACGAFYAALDLPPYADPAYFDAWTAADRGSPYHGTAAWLGDALMVLSNFAPEYREAVGDGATIYTDLVRRVELTREGAVTGDAVSLEGPPVPGHTADGAALSCGGERTPWDCWVWSWWVPGAFSADRDARFAARVPLFLHFDLFDVVARSLARAGIVGTITRARRSIVVRNLRAARALGYTRAEDLLRAGAEADGERVAVDEDTIMSASVGSALAAILVAAGATGLGAIFAVTAGIPAALIEAFGRAVGRSTDVFGRREPVYELASISGAFAPQRPPTHPVPEPPAAPAAPPLYVGPVWFPAGPSGPEVTVYDVRPSGGGGGALAVGGGLALLYLLSR